jgi:hypothetical protein
LYLLCNISITCDGCGLGARSTLHISRQISRQATKGKSTECGDVTTSAQSDGHDKGKRTCLPSSKTSVACGGGPVLITTPNPPSPPNKGTKPPPTYVRTCKRACVRESCVKSSAFIVRCQNAERGNCSPTYSEITKVLILYP